jgi:hypothetical protein
LVAYAITLDPRQSKDSKGTSGAKDSIGWGPSAARVGGNIRSFTLEMTAKLMGVELRK